LGIARLSPLLTFLLLDVSTKTRLHTGSQEARARERWSSPSPAILTGGGRLPAILGPVRQPPRIPHNPPSLPPTDQPRFRCPKPGLASLPGGGQKCCLLLLYQGLTDCNPMLKAMQSFLLFLAGARDRDLVKHIEYLKEENKILRGKLPKKITVTARERKSVLRLGKRCGEAIMFVLGIVSLRTFMRWRQNEKKEPKKRTKGKPGRPRTPADIEQLVVRLAEENDWGYARIVGELRKLGIRKVSRTTVLNILRKHEIDTGPKRGPGSWWEFVRRDMQTLWAIDFFGVKVWTRAGFMDFFVLFAVHVGSRRAHVLNVSPNPHQDWVAQQARALCWLSQDAAVP